ncbi:HDOD domain-containing protein [uncultured Rhodoferax sp.]|uniref:HDOD domain-containing protein n=1 Tax=uncultured Rhodoferax sp. TaxID=223188 RepID=UPI0025D0194E|nr:HDOD domain-containing protein [uncultured Rhodoferax sp.]
MASSVLGNVTMGYQPLWNQWRQRCGVRLWVDPINGQAVDARHLLDALQELWPASAEVQLLSVRSPVLLGDLLEHTPPGGMWLEVPDAWLDDAALTGLVRQAHARSKRMVWSGELSRASRAEVQGCFHKTLRTLGPEEALRALRAALRRTQDGGSGVAGVVPSPMVAGAIYEGLASQALVEHALDHQAVWAVAGWPTEEMLYGYRYRQIQPARQVMRDLVQAIDADESVEALERRMGEEPLLMYRFLRYANSAALALRNEVGSVRQGLMNLGYSRLRAWLMEQMPHASGDANLQPIRAGMVLRARIMERLADAGAEEDLRREVFLCGIFSQVDLLLGDNLGAALHRLPLPGRVASAVLGNTGPYAPWLEVARALEGSSTKVIREVCKAHDMPTDQVNRALLRSLATQA